MRRGWQKGHQVDSRIWMQGQVTPGWHGFRQNTLVMWVLGEDSGSVTTKSWGPRDQRAGGFPLIRVQVVFKS